MPSKTIEEITDLLIRRNACLYHYANGIRRYTEALRKIRRLENQLLSLSRNAENGESDFKTTPTVLGSKVVDLRVDLKV